MWVSVDRGRGAIYGARGGIGYPDTTLVYRGGIIGVQTRNTEGNMSNTTRLTIYTPRGYPGCREIRAALGTNGIESNITIGGLSVYVTPKDRDTFESIMADYPDATYRAGDSLDRWVHPDRERPNYD